MPLSNGVRPLIEDFPDKEAKKWVTMMHISETTPDVMNILKEEEEKPMPEVTREMLEKTPQNLTGQTKTARKQLMNAIYGLQGDSEDPWLKRMGMTGNQEDKAKFLQRTLGRKVTNLWNSGARVSKGSGAHYANEGDPKAYGFPIHAKKGKNGVEAAAGKGSNVKMDFLSAQLRKIGDHDPNLPDKRGAYKIPLAFLPISSSSAPRPSTAPASRSAPAFAAGLGQPRGSRVEVREEMTLSAAIKAGTPSTLPGILQAKGVRPSLALSVIMQVLQSIFDKPCFQVDRLQLSPGELIAMANHAETLRFPHHTERERTYLLTFRALCRLKLASLMSSENPDDFKGFTAVPGYTKELLDACELCMANKPAWQSGALHTGFHLNKHVLLVQQVAADRKDGSKNRSELGIVAKTPKMSVSKHSVVKLEEGDHDVSLLAYMSDHPLEPEWYDRLMILRRRDRRFVREDLEDLMVGVLSKKAPVEADRDSPSPDVVSEQVAVHRAASEDKRLTKPKDPFSKRAPRASELRRKPKGPTPAQEVLLDTPKYWLENRTTSAGAEKEDAALTSRGEKVLRSLVSDDDDTYFKRGKSYIYASDLASKALARAAAKKDSVSALSQTLEHNQEVARTAGVPFGKFHKDPGDLPGASRGACVFRLVPSFVFHEGKRAQHPIMRPPASEIKDYDQFVEVQRLLESPHVDTKGVYDGDGPWINRPPTANKRSHRMRFIAEEECHSPNSWAAMESGMSRGRPQPPPGRPQSARVMNSAARGGLAGRRPVSAGPRAGVQEERGAGDGCKEPHEHGAGRLGHDSEAAGNTSVESEMDDSFVGKRDTPRSPGGRVSNSGS